MMTKTRTGKRTIQTVRYRFVLYGDDSDRAADPEAAWLYAIEAALVAFGLPFITVRAGEPIPPRSEPAQQTVVFHSRKNPPPEGKHTIRFCCYESAVRFVAQTIISGTVPARPASSPIVFVTDPDLVFDPTANWVFAVMAVARMLGLECHELDQFEPDGLADAIPCGAVLIAPYRAALTESVPCVATITDFDTAARFVLAQAGIATVPYTEEEEVVP